MFRGSYGQMDGVAMKSPFAAVLANWFMGHHEQIWLNEYNWPSLLLCRRYVDDTFCLFNNKGDASQFFNYINKWHPKIEFTMEKQYTNGIPFLDVRVNNSKNQVITSTFHVNFSTWAVFQINHARVITSRPLKSMRFILRGSFSHSHPNPLAFPQKIRWVGSQVSTLIKSNQIILLMRDTLKMLK